MNTPDSLPAVRTYPGRLISKIPLPHWMTWLILWEIVFLIDYLYSLRIPGGHDHIAAFGIISLFFASVCITVMYCASVLTHLYPDMVLFIDNNEPELRSWYQQKLQRCYESYWPVLAGIVFVAAEELTIGDLVRSYTPDESVIQRLRTGYLIVGFFFLGVSLWALVSVLLIPMQLIRFKIKVSLNQLSGHGLQALGAAFFKMSIAITVPGSGIGEITERSLFRKHAASERIV